MVNFLIFLLAILAVYAIIFCFYYAACVISSAQAKKFLQKQKYNAASRPNNVILVIYARNNEATIVPLLEALNKQNYPKECYQTHIILDHCTDNSSNILEFIGGAKIWRVGENAPVGKDEAVSWILEGLLSYQNVDAFVFLNADRYIDENFLASINANLFGEDVIIGSTDYIVRIKTLANRIKTAYHSYVNRVLDCGRSLLGLATVVDSDVFVIRKEVLDKIKCVDFKDINSELKYTTLLVRNGFIPKFCPLVKTFTSIENFKSRKPSVSFKLNLVRNCLPLLFSSTPKFGEFLMNILAPNFWFFTLIYLSVFTFSYNYYFAIHYGLIAFAGLLAIVSFAVSLYTSKLGGQNVPYLLLYPFYSLLKIFLHIPILEKIFNKITKKESEEDKESTTVDVYVTDGKNNLPCKLDLISESGLVKAIFRFKKKKYSSSSQIRMVDAIKEVSDKLSEHGFRIKICQSCGYFNLKMDGSTNMVKGYCNRVVLQKESDTPLDTVLWNACHYFVPQEVNKIIDINNFRD